MTMMMFYAPLITYISAQEVLFTASALALLFVLFLWDIISSTQRDEETAIHQLILSIAEAVDDNINKSTVAVLSGATYPITTTYDSVTSHALVTFQRTTCTAITTTARRFRGFAYDGLVNLSYHHLVSSWRAPASNPLNTILVSSNINVTAAATDNHALVPFQRTTSTAITAATPRIRGFVDDEHAHLSYHQLFYFRHAPTRNTLSTILATSNLNITTATTATQPICKRYYHDIPFGSMASSVEPGRPYICDMQYKVLRCIYPCTLDPSFGWSHRVPQTVAFCAVLGVTGVKIRFTDSSSDLTQVTFINKQLLGGYYLVIFDEELGPENSSFAEKRLRDEKETISPTNANKRRRIEATNAATVASSCNEGTTLVSSSLDVIQDQTSLAPTLSDDISTEHFKITRVQVPLLEKSQEDIFNESDDLEGIDDNEGVIAPVQDDYAMLVRQEWYQEAVVPSLSVAENLPPTCKLGSRMPFKRDREEKNDTSPTKKRRRLEAAGVATVALPTATNSSLCPSLLASNECNKETTLMSSSLDTSKEETSSLAPSSPYATTTDDLEIAVEPPDVTVLVPLLASLDASEEESALVLLSDSSEPGVDWPQEDISGIDGDLDIDDDLDFNGVSVAGHPDCCEEQVDNISDDDEDSTSHRDTTLSACSMDYQDSMLYEEEFVAVNEHRTCMGFKRARHHKDFIEAEPCSMDFDDSMLYEEYDDVDDNRARTCFKRARYERDYRSYHVRPFRV